MRNVIAFWLAVAGVLPGAAVAQGLDATQLAALRSVDLRLATIGQRLVTANAPLCVDLMPATGLVIHALAQYDEDTRAAARTAFGFATPLSVEAVVAGSPGARAGVRADDGIVTIDGAAPQTGGVASADRDALVARIVAHDVARPLTMTVRRAHGDVGVTIAPLAGCRAIFEVVLGPGFTATSDGRIIQIGVRYFETMDDDAIAVVVAHELAHNILRHRARLDAAGVSRGALRELGRSGRLWRRSEDEADLLGVHLLYNAGYDPASAAAFWRGPGDRLDGGLFRSRTHASSEQRARVLAAEAARLRGVARPSMPALLASRDRPLD